MTNIKKSGFGRVELVCVDANKGGKSSKYRHSEAVDIKCGYPMKILIPDHVVVGPCKWIYPITFGGGLVGGDSMKLDIHIGEGCCALLTSQESTKIYHCEDARETTQVFTFTVDKGALLCVLPDYLVCYSDAIYKQTQNIEMSSSGNLVFLDWLTAGRMARGEQWQFNRFMNRTQVSVDGNLIFKDQVCLQDQPNITVFNSMKHFKVTGTCLVIGHHLHDVAKTLSQDIARTKSFGESYDTETVCSLSWVDNDAKLPFLYIRFLATSTAKAHGVIEKITESLLPFIESDPFKNKH